MKVISISKYEDGGSVAFQTNEGTFVIDHRIRTETPGEIYEGYPEDDGGNMHTDSDEIKSEIKDAVIECWAKLRPMERQIAKTELGIK